VFYGAAEFSRDLDSRSVRSSGRQVKSIACLAAGASIATAAIAQWLVLGERIGAAIWAFYKFWGYGGGGAISVNLNTQVIFFILSTMLSLTALALSRSNGFRAGHLVFSILTTYSARSLGFGMLLWTLVLLSPLTVVQ